MICDMGVTREGKIAVAINGRVQAQFETVKEARAWVNAGAPGAKLLTPEVIMMAMTMLVFISPLFASAMGWL